MSSPDPHPQDSTAPARAAADAVRRHNRTLQFLSETFPEGVVYQYTVTAGGEKLLTYLGRGAEQIFGERPPELPIDVAWLTARILPEDEPGIAAAGEQSRREFTRFFHDVRIRAQDGSIRWVSIRTQPRELDDGDVVWDGVLLDVTAQHRTEDSVQRQLEFLAALNQTTLELVGRRKVGELLQALAERASALLHSPHAEISLLEGGELAVRAFSRGREYLAGDRVTRAEAALSWRAIDTRAPVVTNDYNAEPDSRVVYRAHRLRAVAVFPIVRNGQCVGVLGLAREQPGLAFTAADIQEGELLARMAALVLHNAAIHEEAARETEARTVALRENLALLRATLESTADGLLVVNAAGRIASFNQNFADMWRLDARPGEPFDEAEILHAIIDQLVAPEKFLAGVREIYARSEEETFDVLHGKDRRVFERYSRPQLLAGQPAGRVWSFRDVTRRRRAEAALRESEERFRVLAEVSPVGIFSCDPTGATTFVNRRWCELSGLEPEQALGDGWMIALHPDDRARVAAGWAEAVQHGESSAAEYRFLRPDGTVVWLVGQSRAHFDSEGKLAGYVGTITDVTTLRRAEEERKRAELQLRQSQKMEALGTLAGGIAHDFNNILNGTFGFVDLARLELPAEHPVHAWLDRIAASSQRARELVRQILTFSRKQEGERIALRLHIVVAEALRLLRSTLPPAVQLEPMISPDAPAVLADATQIHQVILNLCTNAWHAMPERGGRIQITLEPCIVTPAQAATHPDLRAGPCARLVVADDGCGMDARTLEHIFEPFFTTKETGKGTGLGLAVVHGIVKAHEGAILVHSAAGQGTTFELFFPAAAAEPAAPAAAPAEIPRGHGERVLVVDDDPVSGFAIEKLVESLGYQVTRCTRPEEALTRFAAAPSSYDLVVSDLAMPGMNGEELIGHLLKICPEIPVVVASGYIESARQRLLEKGLARAVLGKPVLRPDLARALAQSLHAGR